MWKRFEVVWRKIEGGVIWDAIKWLMSLSLRTKAAALMFTFVASLLSYLRGLPWPIWGFCGLAAAALGVLIFSASVEAKRREAEAEKKTVLLEKTLDLKIVPHTLNSPEAILEVTNEGDPITLSASLRIIGVSANRLFKTTTFDGQWVTRLTLQQARNGTQKASSKKVRIERHGYKHLRIASIESGQDAREMQEMSIEGTGESIWWEFSKDANNRLPFFEIQVTFFSGDMSKPLTKNFKVGPKTFAGPLEMTEVQS